MSGSPLQLEPEDATIRAILEGTAAHTGPEFFAALVRHLALALDVTGAWVTELLPGRRLRSFAFWFKGAYVEHFEYATENTPCGAVINQTRIVHIPENVIQLYPDDADLPSDSVSYVGLPLLDAAGTVFGHLAALDVKPFALTPRVEAILRVFAARAGAEILRLRSDQTARDLRAELAEVSPQREMLGKSKAMEQLLELVRQVAPTDASVLIQGETGTGKELVARAIHECSRRRDKPLVRVNCAAIPAALMESEFFGHERGAFTGATQRRDGRFALADGGTLFLDEVGELPLDLQSKLLRVLQEGEFEPVGSGRTRKVDVRIVTATNRDLRSEAEQGRFRMDLYYRLNVFPLETPPLRVRGCDVALLAAAFLQRAAQKMGRRFRALSPAAEELLQRYDWPGNVRELENVMERAAILARGEDVVLPAELFPAKASAGAHVSSAAAAAPPQEPDSVLTAAQLNAFERDNLIRALEQCEWRVAGASGAAALLGMPASTVASRMKALGVDRMGSKTATAREIS